MMRLRVKRLGSGQHPSEVVVAVTTSDDREEQVVVDELSLEGDGLEIGWPIDVRGNESLVELPRETVRGSWRLWVPSDALLSNEIAA